MTVITGRLLPPRMNSGLVLVEPASSPTTVDVVLLSGGQRRRAVHVARQAGCEVDEHVTWFPAEGTIGSVSELERFKQHRR